MSLVSCIIPYFNGGDTVARAIDSVIYSPHCLELIVVADASPQPLEPHLTPAQLEQIRAGKLRVVKLASNHGQACARNIGASISVGAYLSFLDQDDMYLPGFYESLIPHLEKNPDLGAVEVGAEYYQDGRNVLDEPDPRYAAAMRSVPWNVLVRRNIFWACGAFPVGAEFRTELAAEDLAFKTALRRWFPVWIADNKFVRHHVRPGAATDRYLKRTEVVGGKVVYKTMHAKESDGNIGQAIDAHLQRAWKALKAERAVALNEVEAGK